PRRRGRRWSERRAPRSGARSPYWPIPGATGSASSSSLAAATTPSSSEPRRELGETVASEGEPRSAREARWFSGRAGALGDELPIEQAHAPHQEIQQEQHQRRIDEALPELLL